MDFYNGNDEGIGVHSVKVTIQEGKRIGSFIVQIYGNCHGSDILHFFSFQNFFFSVFSSKTLIIMRMPEKKDSFFLSFPDDNEELICNSSELENMVIGIEIIDYKEVDDAPICMSTCDKEVEFDHCTFHSWLMWSVKNFCELLEKRYLNLKKS